MKRRLGPQHIETFRAVVMTGSMTKAANERNTSQSQVSRLISQLEEIVGFPLFVRKGTRLTTSVEGARFYEEVEKSYISLMHLEAFATDIRSFRSEHLRVAAMPRVAGGLLTRAVAAFKFDHPDVMVSIHSGTASAVQDWINSGICDVGLTMNYGGSGDKTDVAPIITMNCVCILPVGHRLSSRAQISAEDLIDENFITFPVGSSLRAQIDRFFGEEGIRPRIVAETDIGASACALVAAGIGVSLINPIAASDESSGVQIVVRPIAPNFTVALMLAFPPHRQRSHLVKRFETYARREVEKYARTGLHQWTQALRTLNVDCS